MNSNDVETIFSAALEKFSPDERAAYLDEACGADRDLRLRVEKLLEAQAEAGTFMRQPAVERDVQAELPGIREGAGTTIGPYTLLESIGEGGFGVVYLAQQTDPIERQVALKIIKLGMDTRQVIRRFEAERQALAMMDHPHIAKVLDAGATESGRPYFVMELVRGISITQFCDENKLTTRQRLELFIPVCQAIQHAHQKAIIHRDIKPSNVLVTMHDDRAVPKVIDFGIAKATQSELTARTVSEEFQQLIGTPAYMSPEQAQAGGLDIDTRCDVYALGVLLYQLITGATPFDSKTLLEGGYTEICRRICEEEPPRPHARYKALDEEHRRTIAQSQRIDTDKLVRLLHGDLEWIILKAMEKDRSQRYESASALAADVERYLNHLPIEARRPSVFGRMQRFVRRNRVTVALGSCAAIALVAMLALAVTVGVGRIRSAQVRWAREVAIPDIQRSLESDHLVAAFRTALQAKQHLPGDPVLTDIWNELVTTASVESDPAGATVFIKDWHSAREDWLELGQTPLHEIALPQDRRDQDLGVLRWRFTKEGYQTREFNRSAAQCMADGPIKLPASSIAPAGMVYMPAGKSGDGLPVDAFWIDRFEVTNEAYKEFVDAGGYRNDTYWHQDMVMEGQPVSWSEAMQGFQDQTGHAGPATWSNGTYPVGEQDYPVRGISWYEAAAYAAFVGKDLPTVDHWRWAADVDNAHLIAPLSNFSGIGPQPGGSTRGIGRFDVYDMAGNVKEWCWNETDSLRRCLSGAAWSDPGYMFIMDDAHFAWSRPATVGFRCVTYIDPPASESLASRQPKVRDTTQEVRISRQQVEHNLKQFFAYDRTDLDGRRVTTHRTDLYVDEVINIAAAYGGQRFDIHMMLPRHAQPPYDPILLFPHGGALRTERFDFPDMEGDPRWVSEFLEKGWAICWPVYQGTYERIHGLLGIAQSSTQMRDWIIEISMDLRRSVDYLETRDDLNMDRLVYVGWSWGAGEAATMLAVEPRFQAAVLTSGGYFPFIRRPEVDAFHYAPHVTLPILMINGRYDHEFPVETSQMALFNDLGSSDKHLHPLDAAHGVPITEAVNLAHQWLRDRLRKLGTTPSGGVH